VPYIMVLRCACVFVCVRTHDVHRHVCMRKLFPICLKICSRIKCAHACICAVLRSTCALMQRMLRVRAQSFCPKVFIQSRTIIHFYVSICVCYAPGALNASVNFLCILIVNNIIAFPIGRACHLTRRLSWFLAAAYPSARMSCSSQTIGRFV